MKKLNTIIYSMFIISWLCLNSLFATKRTNDEFDHERSDMSLKKQKIVNTKITEDKNLTDFYFDIKHKICLYLPVSDFIHLQAISQSWHCALNDKNLWISIYNQMNLINFQEKKESFFTLKDAKIAVRNRYLRVLINVLNNPEKIYYLVHHYKLHRFWDSFFGNMLNHISHFSNLTFSEKKELYAQGDIMAPENYIEYYQERNTEASQTIRAINDWMIDQRDEKAIERKIKSVYYGYEQENVEKLIDYFVERGSHAAILAKIYRYVTDSSLHEEGHQLIESLIDQGNDQAKLCKAHALAHGLYGYKKNIPAALKISDEIALRIGDSKAMKIRLEETYNYGVSKKDYYVVSSDIKRNFIEQLVSKRFPKSFYYKIHGLNEGLYGYNKNQVLAKEFIEELVFEHNMEGFKYKLEGIEKGIFGYPKPSYNQEISTIEKFIEEMDQKGHPIAMKYKLENTWQQGKEKIEQLEQENHCVGYYLKSLGIKYGIFGFEKDRECAVQYILTYSIPY